MNKNRSLNPRPLFSLCLMIALTMSLVACGDDPVASSDVTADASSDTSDATTSPDMTETTMPPPNVCGDNTRGGAEVCDGTALAGEDCITQGFASGVLACNATCTGFDTSGCINVMDTCGDGMATGAEDCDGADLDDADCVALAMGFTGGALACNTDCTYDTTGCTSSPPCNNDGTCDPGEDVAGCPADCTPMPMCGDGTCDPGEDPTSCPADCMAMPMCGDGTCDPGEDFGSCPDDCPGMCNSDGTCDPDEDFGSCPDDCSCGNSTCDPGEDTTSCAGDCACDLHTGTPCPDAAQVCFLGLPDDICGAPSPATLAPTEDCAVAGLSGPCADSGGFGNSYCTNTSPNKLQCLDYCATSEAPFGTVGHPDCRDPLAICADVFSNADLGACIQAPEQSCTDGFDNDTDGLIDDLDGDCVCPVAIAFDLGSVTGSPVGNATINAGGPNNVQGSCGDVGGADLVVAWTAPSDGCFTFDTIGSDFDTVLHIHEECPSFAELGCNDDLGLGGGAPSRVHLEVTAGTRYLIAGEGYDATSGGNIALSINPCGAIEELTGCNPAFCIFAVDPAGQGFDTCTCTLPPANHPVADDLEGPGCWAGVVPGNDFLWTYPLDGYSSFSLTTCDPNMLSADSSVVVLDQGVNELACNEDVDAMNACSAAFGIANPGGSTVIFIDEKELGDYWDSATSRLFQLQLTP